MIKFWVVTPSSIEKPIAYPIFLLIQMAMQYSLEHFCEPLMEDPSYFSKKMFGGLAVYFNDLMVFVIVESPGDREWKGNTYDFDLWNGIMVCTSREHHNSLQTQFSSLVSHPVLGKWLYSPVGDQAFESEVEKIVACVHRGDPRVGIVPGQKKKKKKASKLSQKRGAKKVNKKMLARGRALKKAPKARVPKIAKKAEVAKARKKTKKKKVKSGV